MIQATLNYINFILHVNYNTKRESYTMKLYNLFMLHCVTLDVNIIKCFIMINLSFDDEYVV